MKKVSPFVLLPLLSLLACPEDCGGTTTERAPLVRVLTPESGQTLDRSVRLRVTLENFIQDRTVTSTGAGSVEVYLDRDCVAEGLSVTNEFPRLRLADRQPEIDLQLDVGPHRLCVGLADRNDVALQSQSEVQFTVSAQVLPRVTIVSPKNGGNFYSGESFIFSAENLNIVPRTALSAPNDAYFIVSIDVACPEAGLLVDELPNLIALEDGARTRGIFLSRGPHTVCLGVVGVGGVTLAPRDQIVVNVTGP